MPSRPAQNADCRLIKKTVLGLILDDILNYWLIYCNLWDKKTGSQKMKCKRVKDSILKQITNGTKMKISLTTDWRSESVKVCHRRLRRMQNSEIIDNGRNSHHWQVEPSQITRNRRACSRITPDLHQDYAELSLLRTSKDIWFLFNVFISFSSSLLDYQIRTANSLVVTPHGIEAGFKAWINWILLNFSLN